MGSRGARVSSLDMSPVGTRSVTPGGPGRDQNFIGGKWVESVKGQCSRVFTDAELAELEASGRAGAYGADRR